MALLKQIQNSPLPAPTGPDEDFLIVAEGHLSGNRLKLSLPAVHLGSDINCDIWLPHEDIMPWHALLFKKDTRWLVKSLDPTQPVLVNGSAVNTSVLANGDRLGLGRLIFVLETPDTGRQPSSAKAEDIYSALRVHATAVSAAQVDLYQREAKLADEKRRWKIRCTQIAKELSRRQEILRKKKQLASKGFGIPEKRPLSPCGGSAKKQLAGPIRQPQSPLLDCSGGGTYAIPAQEIGPSLLESAAGDRETVCRLGKSPCTAGSRFGKKLAGPCFKTQKEGAGGGFHAAHPRATGEHFPNPASGK